MKKSIFTRAGVLFLAIICCFSMAIPAVAVTNATLPLENLTLTAKATTDGYVLSPKFQPNTQVYTVSVAEGKMPQSAAAAKALFDIAAPAGTNVKEAFDNDVENRLLTLTTENEAKDKSTVYYIVFTTLKQTATPSKVADINIKKILKTDMMESVPNSGIFDVISNQVKLDTLKFEYTLTAVKIVDGTTVVGNTTIPMPDDVADAVATNGTVTVTTTGTTSTMTMSGWDQKTDVLSQEDADTTDKLAGSKVQDGIFSITYDKVGQYVYTLKEEAGTATGVTYDSTEYQVTVSVVRSDPDDPTSDPVVGWIEVARVEKNEDGSPKVDEHGNPVISKVNFGEGLDEEKYDHATTAITYPFINTLATEDLVINKTVTGDLGDPDQEFEFVITIKGKDLAAKYTISYTDGVKTTLMPATLTTNTERTEGSVTIKMKHGLTATIHELPVGTTYTVKETSDTASDFYATSIIYDEEVAVQADVDAHKAEKVGAGVKKVVVGKELKDKSLLDTLKEATADKNFVTVFNDKTLTPPTGTIADMIPYFAIVAVAVGGFTLFVVVRRRRAYDAE